MSRWNTEEFFLYSPFQIEILLGKLNFVQDFEVGNTSCDWRLHKTCSVTLSQFYSLFFPTHLNERKLSTCYLLLFINSTFVSGKTSTVLIQRFKSNGKVGITKIASMPCRNTSPSRSEKTKYLVHCLTWWSIIVYVHMASTCPIQFQSVFIYLFKR